MNETQLVLMCLAGLIGTALFLGFSSSNWKCTDEEWTNLRMLNDWSGTHNISISSGGLCIIELEQFRNINNLTKEDFPCCCHSE